MQIQSFLHQDTETYSHVLFDAVHKVCAIIDPVLDYNFRSGHSSTEFADSIIAYIKEQKLEVQYIIETHAHADHLSAAQYLKQQLGGKVVIGKYIEQVQQVFSEIFNLEDEFKSDGDPYDGSKQFDLLTDEDTILPLGDIKITAMHVPGHTYADMAYIAQQDEQQVIFVGDTLFAPDVGTARCDFPGGDAGTLYDSIQRILSLPESTKIYLCHDYPPEGRMHCAVTTVAKQKAHNKHVKEGISKAEFIKMRTERDATLAVPQLILPSVQVNIRAGRLPEPESNGVRYIKVPINQLGQ